MLLKACSLIIARNLWYYEEHLNSLKVLLREHGRT